MEDKKTILLAINDTAKKVEENHDGRERQAFGFNNILHQEQAKLLNERPMSRQRQGSVNQYSGILLFLKSKLLKVN